MKKESSGDVKSLEDASRTATEVKAKASTADEVVRKALDNLQDIPAAFKETLEGKVKKLAENLSYEIKKDVVNILPFSVRRSEERKDFIILPSNYEALLDHSTFGPIILFLIEHFPNVKLSDQEFIAGSITAYSREFMLGVMNRIRTGLPETGFKFKFEDKSGAAQGRACVDCEYFLRCAKAFDLERPERFLNQRLFVAGKGKLLNIQVQTLFGAANLKTAQAFLTTLAIVLSNKFTSGARDIDPKFLKYKIDISPIISSITRKVTKQVQNAKTKKMESKIVPVHISKPSTFIEAITDEEIRLLRALEEPWTELDRITQLAIANKGILPADVGRFEKKYKELYNSQNEIVKRLASWRASRRDQIKAFIGKQKKTFKKNMTSEYLQWVCKGERDRRTRSIVWNEDAIYNMMPIHLQRCLDKKSNIAQYMNKSTILTSGVIHQNKSMLFYGEFLNAFEWVPKGSDYDLFITDITESNNERIRDAREQIRVLGEIRHAAREYKVPQHEASAVRPVIESIPESVNQYRNLEEVNEDDEGDY